ncbi:PKD domain-containing protein [Haloarcula japonica]|uniref:PKD domain-containing protein n=1 Tax=Haloarcula japonica TaxID=29282 RepID=UPI0039F6A9D0
MSGIATGIPNSSPVQSASAQTASKPFSLSSESPAMVSPGDSFTVTYTIENTGSSDLNSLGLQATEVPNGFNITSISSADATFISDQQNAVGFPTISPGENATVTFTVQTNATISGDRTLTVETSNGFGANEVTRTQNTTVSVNQQPTADAGNSQPVDEGTNVTLNASGSIDPDGDSLSYNWSQTAGPSVDLDAGTSATPSFTAPATGSEATLTFRVEATDGNGGSDTDTVNITVQPLTQSNFSVDSLNAPAAATQGDEITVSAAISNNGEEAGTQTVQFRVDTDSDGTLGTDEVLASQEVSLGAGETTEITLEELDTSSLEPGDYTHGIFTANDSETATITISSPPEPANFSVDNLEAPSAVTRGSLLTVSAEVSNEGEQSGTQTVQFRVDTNGDGTLGPDEVLATQDVSLSAGDTTEITFEELETDSLAPGSYTHGVFTDNDSETASITISSPPEPANFSVENLDAPTTTTQGNSLTISAEIANEGDQAATQTIQFRVDTNGDGTLGTGEVIASQEVSIEAGETADVTFEDLETGSLAPGDYTHGVFTANASETATIAISAPSEPANFSVDNLNAPTTVIQGDSLTVSANISNNGDQAGTQTVEFRLDADGNGTIETDETLASQSVSLAAGETTEVPFVDLDTSSVEPEEYTHGISTANDSETATITITSPPEPANFSVNNLTAPATATQGDSLTVSAEISNEGGQADTQNVQFRLDTDGSGALEADEILASQNVSLDSEETTEVTFENLDTGSLGPGDYTHGIVTDDNRETATITLSSPPEPANFSISDLTAPTAVTQGDLLTVSANISNNGDQTSTQTVQFRVDTDANGTLESDEVLASQTISLAAGETTEITFEDIDTDSLASGDYTHGVFTGNDSETATITISSPPEPANFSVATLTAPDKVTQGDSLTVSAEIANEGGQAGTQTVQLRVDTDANGTLESDEALASKSVSLGTGETTEVTFENLDTDALAPESYTHGVVTDNDSETATVLVEATNKPPTADAGESQTVKEGSAVTLNASGSSDPDEDALSYTWTQTTGPSATLSNPNAETPSFTAPEVNKDSDLVFEVLVSDGNGGTATDTVNITVQNVATAEPDNEPPDADAGADQTVSENSTATLDATGSSDPDGDSLAYAWMQTSGPDVTLSEANTAAPSFTTPAVNQETNVTFEVTVTDGQGETDTENVTVTVQPLAEEEAFFAVTNLSVPAEVAQGDPLTISATITNTGDAEETQLIEARVDANRNGSQEVIQTQSVTLASGESTTVTTTRTVPANLPTGTYTGGLFTFDSNQTTSVTVISEGPSERNYTRDEIAQAKYGYDFDELSNETARQVEELYLRQPFAAGAQPTDVKTREEIAEDRYGEDFENLSRETTIEIQSDFDAQFGDTGDNAEYTRDEISRAKYYGYNFSELSTETAGQVEELYNRQPFADGLSPSDVQTREEIANEKYGLDVDELSRETRIEVERTYHQQFNGGSE